MQLEISFQLSLFGRTSEELWYQMTGWIISPCSAPSSRTPKFQRPASGRWAYAGMVRGGRPDLAWRIMDAQYWARPRLARRQRVLPRGGFWRAACWRDTVLSPGQCSYLLSLAHRAGCPPPPEIEALLLKQGGVYPSSWPFQPFRMREAAKRRKRTQFQNSFGAPNGPFSTLLAGRLPPSPSGMKMIPWEVVFVSPQSGSVSGCWGCRMGGLSMERTVRPFAPPNGTGLWATPSPCPVPTTSWPGSRRSWPVQSGRGRTMGQPRERAPNDKIKKKGGKRPRLAATRRMTAKLREELSQKRRDQEPNAAVRRRGTGGGIHCGHLLRRSFHHWLGAGQGQSGPPGEAC